MENYINEIIERIENGIFAVTKFGNIEFEDGKYMLSRTNYRLGCEDRRTLTRNEVVDLLENNKL